MAKHDSNQPTRLLVLWDIDHTLIESRGVGRKMYERAFLAATGRSLDNLAQIAGRTELDIMSETLRINGVEPTDDAVAKLATSLTQAYEDGREELGTTGRALPGAHEALKALSQRSGVLQTVLTGNLREVARIKLEVFDLDAMLDLDVGAYGDDEPERAKLVRLAQKQASDKTDVRFGSDETVIVGDTPKDVAAGLQAGVRVIGVATGKSSAEELRKAGATMVLEDLTEAVAELSGHTA